MTREEFYTKLLITGKKILPELFMGVSHRPGRTWLGTTRKNFGLVVNRYESRVEMCIDRKTDEEVVLYKIISSQKKEIEQKFGEPLMISDETKRGKLYWKTDLGFLNLAEHSQLSKILLDKIQKFIDAIDSSGLGNK